MKRHSRRCFSRLSIKQPTGILRNNVLMLEQFLRINFMKVRL